MTTPRQPDPVRPDFVLDEMLAFLDTKKSGGMNMFTATFPLQDAFPWLTRQEARKVLSYWIATYRRYG